MIAGEHFDLVIVGGGINGAGLYRDATKHGLKVLLVEAYTLGSQTSSKSSKMLHGGIRYLKNMDFPLVAEALKEKSLLLQYLPHLCREQTFYLPVYKNSPYQNWEIFLGMHLYDLLSGYASPRPSYLGKNKLQELPTMLSRTNLLGAGKYYDGVVDDLAMVKWCVESTNSFPHQSRVLEHTELVAILGESHPMQLQLEHKGENITLHCDHLSICVGPFTDQLLLKIFPHHWTEKLLPSKGSHLWLKNSIQLTEGVVIQDKNARVIFCIPHGEKLLLGTTEEAVKTTDSFSDCKITQEETDYLLEQFNFYFPTAHYTQDHIIGSFAGIRPLAKGQGSDLGKTSRYHQIYFPQSNCSVLIGGKYTTFRIMVKDLLTKILKQKQKSYCEQLFYT
jgi:glycerol-3-phosphate dehydrogenase